MSLNRLFFFLNPTVYLPLSIDQTFTLNNSTLITTIFGLCCNILHDNIHTDRLLNTILLPMYQEMILKETIFHHLSLSFKASKNGLQVAKNVNIGYWWVGFTGGQYSINFQSFKPILTGKKQLFRKDKWNNDLTPSPPEKSSLVKRYFQ